VAQVAGNAVEDHATAFIKREGIAVAAGCVAAAHKNHQVVCLFQALHDNAEVT